MKTFLSAITSQEEDMNFGGEILFVIVVVCGVLTSNGLGGGR